MQQQPDIAARVTITNPSGSISESPQGTSDTAEQEQTMEQGAPNGGTEC